METAGSRRRGQRGGRRSPPCPKAPCPARRDQGTRLLRAQRDEGQVTTSEGQRVPGGDSTHLEERVPGGGHAGGQKAPRGTGGARGDSASGDSGCRKAQHGSRGSWCPEGQLVFWGQRVPERAGIRRDSACLKGQHVAGGQQALGGRHVPGDSVRPGDSVPTASLQGSHGDSRAGDVPVASQIRPWLCDATPSSPQPAPTQGHGVSPRCHPEGVPSLGSPEVSKPTSASPPRPHPRFWDIPTPWGLQGRGRTGGQPLGLC